MQWIITVDHINGKPGDPTPSRVNHRRWHIGFGEMFRAADEATRERILQQFKDSMNYEFRLFDDDGELYYEGLCKDLEAQDEGSAFQPLDWAMNDAGATRMDYRAIGDDEWETL